MLSSNVYMHWSVVNGSEQSLKYRKLSYFIPMPNCIYSEKVSQEIPHHVVFCKLYFKEPKYYRIS